MRLLGGWVKLNPFPLYLSLKLMVILLSITTVSAPIPRVDIVMGDIGS